MISSLSDLVSVISKSTISSRMAESELLLQFLPFSSVVSSDFWHKLSQLKIDIFALSDEPVDITGYYNNRTPPKLPACFNVDYSSFDKYKIIVFILLHYIYSVYFFYLADHQRLKGTPSWPAEEF